MNKGKLSFYEKILLLFALFFCLIGPGLPESVIVALFQCKGFLLCTGLVICLSLFVTYILRIKKYGYNVGRVGRYQGKKAKQKRYLIPFFKGLWKGLIEGLKYAFAFAWWNAAQKPPSKQKKNVQRNQKQNGQRKQKQNGQGKQKQNGQQQNGQQQNGQQLSKKQRRKLRQQQAQARQAQQGNNAQSA